MARSGPTLTYAKVIAALAIACLALVEPAFAMHPPGGLRPHPLEGCRRPSAPVRCRARVKLPPGYGPRQIRRAYRIQPLLDAGKDGSGQTITIIDSFQSPTIANDLAKFDSAFHLPAPPSFTTLAPFGLTPFNPNNEDQFGWSQEIAVDVEWAHAIAPGASIVLALAPSDTDPDQIKTERFVVEHHIGSVVSMSFGEAEVCMASHLQREQHAVLRAATSHGITLLAASGDLGASNGAPPWPCSGASLIKAVSTPGSDPNVTGVGGTDLVANLKTGRYRRESVWNEGIDGGAGGGGFSSLYSRPSYQARAVRRSRRGLPDVVYSASSRHSVVYAWLSSGESGQFWSGDSGTSFGAPQWAGIVAIADQIAGHGLGNINPKLYSLAHRGAKSSVFHDITVGNNNFGSIRGYSAHPGWDAASGLGSPIASRLVSALAGVRRHNHRCGHDQDRLRKDRCVKHDNDEDDWRSRRE